MKKLSKKDAQRAFDKLAEVDRILEDADLTWDAGEFMYWLWTRFDIDSRGIFKKEIPPRSGCEFPTETEEYYFGENVILERFRIWFLDAIKHQIHLAMGNDDPVVTVSIASWYPSIDDCIRQNSNIECYAIVDTGGHCERIGIAIENIPQALAIAQKESKHIVIAEIVGFVASTVKKESQQDISKGILNRFGYDVAYNMKNPPSIAILRDKNSGEVVWSADRGDRYAPVLQFQSTSPGMVA